MAEAKQKKDSFKRFRKAQCAVKKGGANSRWMEQQVSERNGISKRVDGRKRWKFQPTSWGQVTQGAPFRVVGVWESGERRPVALGVRIELNIQLSPIPRRRLKVSSALIYQDEKR